jgi:hypothetical protein
MPSDFKLPVDFKKHAITFLSFAGKEKLSTQENLFEVIQKFERQFVVDNHIDWFGLSAVPENSNTAFILGTTADRESSPLRLLLEDKSGKPKIRQNVFLFGMKSPTQEDILAGHLTPLLVISRLDEYATAVLNMDGLRRFDQPGGDKGKWSSLKSIADEKNKVLALLSASRIEEVEQVTNRQMEDEKLRLLIEQKKPGCFKRFWESNDVARLAYARLLLGRKSVSRKTRNEFADPNNPNVFGDLHLIQNALFFNAGFASNDKAVMTMARLCGLPRLEPPVSNGHCACQWTETN